MLKNQIVMYTLYSQAKSTVGRCIIHNCLISLANIIV